MRKPKTSTEKRKANKAFSDYIRERDHWTCYTCGRHVTPQTGDAGHLFSRYWAGTLYNEINVHCQCKRCNMLHEVDSEPYRKKFIEDYGQDTYDDLYRQSKDTVKRTVADYIEIRQGYERKLAALRG
jgi:rubredoxin